MIRKNFHEYLFSLQEPDDIYSMYRQHRKNIYEKFQHRSSENHVKHLTEKALKEAIKEIFNAK